MRKIIVTVSPTGEAKVEASGFTGAACLKATSAIEDAIGRLSDRKPKPEMGGIPNHQITEQK